MPSPFAPAELNVLTSGKPVAYAYGHVSVQVATEKSTMNPSRPSIDTGVGSVVTRPGSVVSHVAIELASRPTPGSGFVTQRSA